MEVLKLWEQLHWIRPQALWLLIPVVLFPVLYLIRRDKSDQWVQRIASHLRQYVILKGNLKALYAARVLLIFGWIVIVISVSGPSFEQVEKPGAKVESTGLIMLQLSESMLKEDLQPNRLERAKYKIKDLLSANPGIRMGLVAYAGSAHLVIPPTTDYETLELHLEALKPGIMPKKGVNIDEALVLADTLVRKNTAPSHFIFMSDMPDDADVETMKQFVQGKEDQVTIMPFTALTEDVNNRAIILNKESNVQFLLPTLDASDVELLATTLEENKLYQDDPELQESMWVEHGYYLLWILAFIILIWFRKGFMPTLILAVLLSSCSGNHSAKDLFLTKDYQGQKAMDEGNYMEAAKLFEDPMQKGTAYFKAGDYKKAIEAFRKDTTAQGFYNLGLSYLKEENYNAAYNAFYRSKMLDNAFTQSDIAIDKVQQWFLKQNNEFEALSNTEVEALFEKMIENTNAEEDLGGGGQEATEEQMQDERLMEEVESEVHAGEEQEEVPEEFDTPEEMDARKVIIRDVKEDPGEFLRRKFEYQLKKRNE